jgi:hypothetical protein
MKAFLDDYFNRDVLEDSRAGEQDVSLSWNIAVGASATAAWEWVSA